VAGRRPEFSRDHPVGAAEIGMALAAAGAERRAAGLAARLWYEAMVRGYGKRGGYPTRHAH